MVRTRSDGLTFGGSDRFPVYEGFLAHEPPREVVTRTDILREWLPRVGVAFAAGLAGVAGSYLLTGRRPAFVVTPFDALVVAYTPDAIVGWAITTLGDVGHQLAFLMAILLAGAVLGVTALPALIALHQDQDLLALILGAVLPGLTALAVTGAPASGIGAGFGAGLVLVGTWLGPGRDVTVDHSARRSVLGAVAAAVGIGTLSVLVRGTGSEPTSSGVDIPEDARPAVTDALTQAREQSLDVEGLEPLVSTDFYEVDINNINPEVEREGWTLSVTGAVDTEREYTFADLQAMGREDRFVTLRCVGDYLNGRKMDNALWTGVPADAILEQVSPQGEFVMLRAADNYYNEFPIEALWPGMLAYEMNGRPLPRRHGAPVRALVPGHWGEINVKWLTEIEVLDRPAEGYWEQRGWNGTGPVETVAKLWQTNHLDGGVVEVAGHAYAGTRGIDTVEVSADGGQTWTEAELSEPLPGDDVWRQWRHRYQASEQHEVVVRAIDGTGAVQIPEKEGPRPNGATGWVSERIRPP